MNILFLTIGYPENVKDRNIYTDLMKEFKENGHNIYVVAARERRNKKETELVNENDITVLRVKTGNMQKVNFLEKGISTLLIESQYINSIRKYLKNIKFDLVLYTTPPITFEKVVKFIKQRDNCSSYLLLKDIFPQNAVDIRIIKQNSIIHKYFRKKEMSLYKISNYIGCMSRANVSYVLSHNKQLDAQKLEVCPNSIKPMSISITDEDKSMLKERYNIPTETTIFGYGGNLGKPQGIDFLIEVLTANKNNKDVYFLIIGNGTEYKKIEDYIKNSSITNAQLYSHMPKFDYDNIINLFDVGLIFLDGRFTIPNFPSRLLTYMEFSLPILAATDINTDIREIIENEEIGFWTESGSIVEFNKNINLLCNDKKLRQEMGKKARLYLEKNYTVNRSYEIIMSHFK